MEVTQEQLANMSPEQIAELQKQQCIFCHIVSGKVASRKVFENDLSIGILDINPANPGHILLITKEHYQIMPQVPEETIGHLFMVVKHLSQAALKALKVKGVNVFIANGIAAGQKAPHFMIHIIPRTDDDGLKFIIPQKRIVKKDLELLKKNIKSRVNIAFGLKQEEPIDLDVGPEKIGQEKVVEAEFEDEEEKQEEGEDQEEVESQEEETEQETDDDEQEDEHDEEDDSDDEPDAAEPVDKKADLDRIAELFS